MAARPARRPLAGGGAAAKSMEKPGGVPAGARPVHQARAGRRPPLRQQPHRVLCAVGVGQHGVRRLHLPPRRRADDLRREHAHQRACPCRGPLGGGPPLQGDEGGGGGFPGGQLHLHLPPQGVRPAGGSRRGAAATRAGPQAGLPRRPVHPEQPDKPIRALRGGGARRRRV